MKINHYLLSFIFFGLLAFHSHGETLNVAVAANFKQTLSAIKTQFEAQTSHKINIITASTGQLTQQISQGAPYDVLLAANSTHPQTLWENLKQSRQLSADALYTYALGRLVFYTRTPFKNSDLLTDVLKSSQFDRISIANPKLAPYGLAAIETLKCLKQYDHWQNNLVVGQNIAQAFQFIDSRSVNAGFVALSQVLDKPVSQIKLVDSSCYPPIKQTALRLNNKKGSVQFLEFLKSQPVKNTIEINGYFIPNEQG